MKESEAALFENSQTKQGFTLKYLSKNDPTDLYWTAVLQRKLPLTGYKS